MDETAQEIRQREQQSATNETPDVVDDGGDEGGDGGGSSLPVPSIDKRQLAVIGAVIIVAVVAWQLYQRQSDGSSNGGTSIAEEREKLDDSRTIEAAPDEEEERIEVPIDPADPLAADKAVTQVLRDNGKLTDPGER